MAEARLVKAIRFGQRCHGFGRGSTNALLLTFGRLRRMTTTFADPGMGRKSRDPVGRVEPRPRHLAGRDEAFQIAIRSPRRNLLGPWHRREARMELSDGFPGWHLIEVGDHSRPSGTSSNRLTSTSPRSVIFSSGMTERARKLTLMNGPAIETPIPARRRSIELSLSCT